MGKMNDIVIVCCVVIFFIIGLFLGNPVFNETIFCFFVGSIIVFSKRFKDESYIHKCAYWIVINIFKPKTSVNHYIWGSFFIFFGLVPLFIPATESSPSNAGIENIHKTSEFWIGIVLILLFNILVGVLTFLRNTKKE